MNRANSEMFPTERIAFRVDGVPTAGPRWRVWRKALRVAAIEARTFAPRWIGIGPLACYIRLVTPRPKIAIDLAAAAGEGVDPGKSYWNTNRNAAWVFDAVLRPLGGGKEKAGILWDNIQQICFPIADIRVRAKGDEPHTVVVVTELPPIECGFAVDMRGLIAEADSWSDRGEGLRG